MPYTNTAARLGLGTLFGLSDNATPPTYTTIAEVVSVSGPGLKRDAVDATYMESAAREVIYALLDTGEVTIELNFLPSDPTQKSRADDLTSATPAPKTYRIAWPDMATQSLTATEAANVWTTATAHNFATPQPVSFSTTGTLPAPLAPGAYYVARYESATTFNLFATSADAVNNVNPITLTGGSGTHTVHSGASWIFSALITGIEPSAKVEDKLSASVTFKVTGAPTLP